MRYPDGTYDMTVDDIHEIREKNSKMFETMSKDEIINYINNGAKDFFDRVSDKNLVLA